MREALIPADRALAAVRHRSEIAADRSAWQLRRELAGPRWVRRGGGWFVDPAIEVPRWYLDLAVLVRRHEPDALVSRASAAALWELDGFEARGRGTVRIPAGRRAAPGAHRSRWRAPGERVAGWPVTSPAETLLDLGHDLAAAPRWAGDRHPVEPSEQVELALEAALRRRLVSVSDLVELLAANPGRAATLGARRLRAVLDRRPAGAPPTESHLETRAVQLLRHHGLPEPRRQVELRTPEGRFVARVDLVVGGLVLELDGRATHEGRFQEDRTRWSAIAALGFRTMVMTADDIERRPSASARAVAAALRSPQTGGWA